jgi:hypothetical protein
MTLDNGKDFLNQVCEDLYHIEDEAHTLRQHVENYRTELVKQGLRIPITRKPYDCSLCSAQFSEPDELGAHLRDTHEYTAEDVFVSITNALIEYEVGLNDLQGLLSEYTEAKLDGH